MNQSFNEKISLFWHHPRALACTAPILLALSFPPFNLSLLQIPAFIFLVRVSMLSQSKKQVFYYSYPSFILWNLFSTYWLMMATVAGGVAAIFANALIMVLPLLFIRYFFRSGMNFITASFLGATAWVSYEFLHHNWDLAWPWLTLGNGWANHTAAIQYISFTGVFGVSFWVVASSLLIYSTIMHSSKKNFFTATFVFLLFPALSLVSMLLIPTEQGNSVNVVIVQPNSNSYEQYGGLSSLDELLNKLLFLSNEVRTEDTDVIIWPENAVDTSLSINSPHLQRIQDSLQVWDTSLMTGSGFIDFYDDNNAPEVTRKTTTDRLYNVYNAAFFMQPQSTPEVYKKGKLVPIVERFPFVNFFHHIDIFNWIDWGPISGYGLGTEPTLFTINDTQTPALICYDSIFSGWVNKFVQNGAGFLTIITNDGWWGDSHGHTQHFAFARLRAIEHRMWIARSANNGISGIISPDGNVQIETEYWTETAFPFTIYNNQNPTFYTRYGNWLGYISLLFFVFGVITVRIRK